MTQPTNPWERSVEYDATPDPATAAPGTHALPDVDTSQDPSYAFSAATEEGMALPDDDRGPLWTHSEAEPDTDPAAAESTPVSDAASATSAEPVLSEGAADVDAWAQATEHQTDLVPHHAGAEQDVVEAELVEVEGESEVSSDVPADEVVDADDAAEAPAAALDLGQDEPVTPLGTDFAVASDPSLGTSSTSAEFSVPAPRAGATPTGSFDLPDTPTSSASAPEPPSFSGAEAGYGQPASPHGQPTPGAYGQANASPYGQPTPNPYGQPAPGSPGQSLGYGADYGQPAPQYGQAGGYGQGPASQYAEPTGAAPAQYQQPGYGTQPQYGAQPGYGAQQAHGQVAPYGQQPYGYQGSQISPSEENTFASMAHWLGIFTGFVGPLIIMVAQGDKSPRVRAAAVESLNFQLTLLIGYVASFVLTFLLIGVVGFLILPLLQIIFPIMAALAENRGESYRYPFNIRMVK